MQKASNFDRTHRRVVRDITDSLVVAVAHGQTFDEAKANAALIVRSVNAHEKLVEALEALVRETDGLLSVVDNDVVGDGWGLRVADCLSAARSALAVARGEA